MSADNEMSSLKIKFMQTVFQKKFDLRFNC